MSIVKAANYLSDKGYPALLEFSMAGTAISAAMKVPLEADFKALEDLVASEKAKKEKKVETVKPKKSSAKKTQLK